MSFIFRIIAYLAVAWFPFAATAADGNIKTQMLDPVVKINNDCSASIISSVADSKGKVKTQLLTAKHCVTNEGAVNIEMFDDEGRFIEIRNVWFDKDRVHTTEDIGLLTLRDTTNVYPTVKLAERVVAQQGDRVWVVGFPFGYTKSITDGLFNATHRVKYPVKDTPYFRSTPAIAPGNSGGGLFQKNGDNYELIGVASAYIRETNHAGLFVRLPEIQKFLRLRGTRVQIELPPLPILK